MEIMNIKNNPILFLPLSAFSDPVVTGKEYHYGVNVNIANNDFFRYLYVIDPRDLETEERDRVLSEASACAAERSEPGIIMMAVRNHLSVIAARLEDQGFFPIIFNAAFATEEMEAGNRGFYRLYDGVDGEILGGGLAIHDTDSNILWDDVQLEDFSSKAE